MELTDIIHFYLGCDMITDQGRGKLVAVNTDEYDCPFRVMLDSGDEPEELTGCKLILRSHNSMSGTEMRNLKKELAKPRPSSVTEEATRLSWFIQNRFDVFAAIQCGVAMDAKDYPVYPIAPEA